MPADHPLMEREGSHRPKNARTSPAAGTLPSGYRCHTRDAPATAPPMVCSWLLNHSLRSSLYTRILESRGRNRTPHYQPSPLLRRRRTAATAPRTGGPLRIHRDALRLDAYGLRLSPAKLTLPRRYLRRHHIAGHPNAGYINAKDISWNSKHRNISGRVLRQCKLLPSRSRSRNCPRNFPALLRLSSKSFLHAAVAG